VVWGVRVTSPTRNRYYDPFLVVKPLKSPDRSQATQQMQKVALNTDSPSRSTTVVVGVISQLDEDIYSLVYSLLYI